MVSLEVLYNAFATPRIRKRWLPDTLSVRKKTPQKSIRMIWGDGTAVNAYFTAKTASKSHVAVQHQKLATKAEATKLKAYWGERLNALAAILK